MTPSGKVEIELEIDKNRINIEAVVVNLNGFSVLLGNDCLSKVKSIRVDYRPGEAASFTTLNHFNLIERGTSEGKVVCVEGTSIPALSSVAIPINIKGVIDLPAEEVPIIEPSAKVMEDMGVSSGHVLLPFNPSS